MSEEVSGWLSFKTNSDYFSYINERTSNQKSYFLFWTWTIGNFVLKICQNFSLKTSVLYHYICASFMFIYKYNLATVSIQWYGRSLRISQFNDYNLYNYESYISYLKNAISNWRSGYLFSLMNSSTRAWVMMFLMTKIKVTSPKQYIYMIHCFQLLFSK